MDNYDKIWGIEVKKYLILLFLLFSIPSFAQNYSANPDSSVRATLATAFTPDSLGAWTVEFWVKREHNDVTMFIGQNATSEPRIFFPQLTFNGPYWAGHSDWGTLGTTVILGDSSVADINKWVHVVFMSKTSGTDSVNVYQGSATENDTLAFGIAGTTKLILTAFFSRSNGATKYDGLIDEIRLWTDERTLDQINANKCVQLAGTEDSLLYYWKFDNGLTSSATANTLTEALGTMKYSATDVPFGTYYVDQTSGNDNNAGNSTTTAWKTIAKVNASLFYPGDIIYFKRGEVWREQLIVSSSGGAGNPIFHGAYGSGVDPIINGSDLVNTWVSSPDTIEDYSARATCEAYYKFENAGDLGEDDQNQIDLTAQNSPAQSADIPSGTYANPSASNSVDLELSESDYFSSTAANASEMNNLSALTFVAWIKPESIDGTDQYIITLGDWGSAALNWYFDNANIYLNGFLYDDPAYEMSAGTWYFLAASWSTTDDTTHIMVGTESAQVSILNTRSAWDTTTIVFENDVNVGRYSGPNNQWVDGLMCEFALFSEELTLGEIQNIQLYGMEGNINSTRYYSLGMSTEPNIVFFDGTNGTSVANSSAVDAQDEWFWTTGGSDSLFINTSTPGDTTNIEAGQRDQCIDVAQTYVNFTDLTLEKANKDNFRLTDGAGHNILTRITSNNSAGHGFYIAGFTGTIDTVTIDNCVANNWNAERTEFNSGVNSYASYDADSLVVTNSTFNGTKSFQNNTSGGENGITLGDGDNNRIEYNEITNVEHGIHIDEKPTAWVLRYNYIHDTADDAFWIQGISATGLVAYNKGINIGDNFIDLGTGTKPDGDAGLFYNNTFYNCYQHAIDFHDSTGRFAEFKNNIIIMTSTATASRGFIRSFGTHDLTSDHVFDNNIFFDVSGTYGGASGVFINMVDSTKTYAEWLSEFSFDANGFNTDPLFTDAASNDFTLKSKSPAIDAGTDVGLTADFDELIVPAPVNRRRVDIGAYEYRLSLGYENRFPKFPDRDKFPRR